jgi:MFS family permease
MDTTPPPRQGLLAALRDTTFRSLRHRNYRLYFVGQIVSFTGSWMQSAALMWLVYDLTADPFWPPFMLVAQVGPTLVLGPVGGMLADRLPKKAVITASQLAFLLNAVVLTAVVATGVSTPWGLFALAVVNGMVQGIDLPARLAYVPDLIPMEDLINAVSLNSLLFNAARAVGPAVTGGLFLLAEAVAPMLANARPLVLGAVWCFALNALSYVAVLASLRRIDAPEQARETKPRGSMLAGFRYVWERKRLAALLACTGCAGVFGWPTLTLFPPYTRLVLNHAEKEFSLLVSALGGGALVAALTTATFGSPSRARAFMSVGSGLTAAGILGLALTAAMPVALLAAAVFGCGMILYLSTGQSVLQLSTPNEARGRVMALWPMTLSGSSIVGNLLAGWVAERHLAIPHLLLVMAAGVGLTAAVVSLLAWRLK